jgi:hypothetical protein
MAMELQVKVTLLGRRAELTHMKRQNLVASSLAVQA